MFRFPLVTVVMLAAGQGALAQPAIGGGAQLQQIPPVTAPPRSLPDLRVERNASPASPEAAGLRVMVSSLRVTGATRFSEADLVQASGFQPGERDLASLRAIAARITEFYNRQGYFVAQAYLPAQDIQGGVVTIAVIEGRYGKVALNNQAHVSDRLAQSRLAGLRGGDLVATAPLESRLLRLSDLPGVVVKSTLTPGDAVGTSDLLVDLTPGRSVDGVVELDNGGSRYTGEWRAGATVNLNEPLGIGDVASLRVLSSGRGLNYGRASYQVQIGQITVGGAYTHLNYRLGREFSPLHASGTVDIASLYASTPLIRSRATNLYGLLDFDAKTFKDKVGVPPSVSDRFAEVLLAGLSGDHTDTLWGGGRTSYAAYASFGELDIRTAAVRAVDAVTARTNGSYQKLTFEAARLQALNGPLSLYGEARGQLASKNLDSSEKMELGGAYGVRAYPEGEAYGDEGYLLTAEARLNLAHLSEATHGQLTAVAFVDHGAVTINKSPWAPGVNRRNLSAAGVGLTWVDPRDLMVKVSYAFKLGDERATSAPDRSGRVWVQITKFF